MKVLLAVLVVLVVARIALPSVVRSYVVRTLNQSPVYSGEIGDVTISLWRGAYDVEDVRISKTSGSVPVPLFAAERLELAIEWRALLAGEVVGTVVMERPEINFVDADDAASSQTGAGGPWLQMLRDLHPFKINSTVVHDGTVHFRAFDTDPPVDVYLSKVEGSVENLTNVHDETTPLVATVTATAEAMDQARFDYRMKLDPFSYQPTFHLGARLVGLDVTKVNTLAKGYGGFDFESGWFDLVVEMDAREGFAEGYVKPLLRDIVILDVADDAPRGNVLELVWEALVGGAKDLFKNQRKDQIATVIPFRGDLGATRTDALATIGNLLRNAFIRAYLPRFEGAAAAEHGIVFGPPAIADGGAEPLQK